MKNTVFYQANGHVPAVTTAGTHLKRREKTAAKSYFTDFHEHFHNDTLLCLRRRNLTDWTISGNGTPAFNSRAVSIPARLIFTHDALRSQSKARSHA